MRYIVKLALVCISGVASWTVAMASGGPLVTSDWLEANLKNPKVRVIEVSVEPGVFERGHIEGAQNIVWHTDLVDTVKRDYREPPIPP